MPGTTGAWGLGLLFWSVVGLLLMAGPAVATERWKVLVVGESGSDSLPAGHPAWQRVDQAIAEQLIASGFSTYDKAALGLTLACSQPPCGNRPVADYVRWAREQRGGIDLIVIYSITAADKQGPAVKRWQVRVPGRMVDVSTAEIVDQWRGGEDELSDQPAGCAEACLRDWLADRLADTGSNVGAILAEKLAAYRREFVYEAQVAGFALGEFDRLEAALRAAPGYSGGSLKMREVRDMHREWLHTRATRGYEFRTPLGGGQLNVLLDGVLDDAGIDAAVRYEAGGRQFSIERRGVPYLCRYVGGLVALILALAAAWIARIYRQHEVALSRVRSPREKLAYLDQLSSRGLPWLPSWRRRARDWRAEASKVDAALSRVQRCVAEDDFEQAAKALAEAEALEPQHPEVKAAAERLPRQRKAAALVAEAKQRQGTEPAAAAHALSEAIKLDEALRPTLKPLMATLQAELRRGAVNSAAQQGQQAMAAGHPYAALRAIGKGISTISGLDGMAAELASLRKLADQARSMITPLTGPARGTGLFERLRIATDDQVDVGRGSVADAGAIGLGYKRASRLGKQTRLLRDRNGLQIEDAGSTNGTQLDGQLLSSGKPVHLHGRHEIALGSNRETESSGACRLIVQVPAGAPNSAIIACDPAPLRVLDREQLAAAWPTRAEDLSATWLALADPISLALGDALLPAGDGDQPVIALGYDNGYFIEPPDNGDASGVRIDGEPVTTRTPISAEAKLSINGRPFGLVAW